MKSQQRARRTSDIREVLERDEVREVLRDTFYTREQSANPSHEVSPLKVSPLKVKATRPEHYEVICISLYREDLSRLDDMVSTLKAAGHRKMSRSALIRYALDTADVSRMPRGY